MDHMNNPLASIFQLNGTSPARTNTTSFKMGTVDSRETEQIIDDGIGTDITKPETDVTFEDDASDYASVEGDIGNDNDNDNNDPAVRRLNYEKQDQRRKEETDDSQIVTTSNNNDNNNSVSSSSSPPPPPPRPPSPTSLLFQGRSGVVGKGRSRKKKSNKPMQMMIELLAEWNSQTSLSHYVQLPQIAVLGDTSSGKSSVLSSLSGIQLPSASKLTTKCSIIITMSPGPKREAVVTVRWNSPSKQSKSAPKYHKKIATEDDVEWSTLVPNCITEAQNLILSSSTSSATYAGSTSSLSQMSSDEIHLSVKGPHIIYDLTLIDLPGLVHYNGTSNNSRQSNDLINDVQKVLEPYWTNPRCVFLTVVSSAVDWHNSIVLRYAQQVDPTTQRTIPVFTKPDLMDPGSEGTVLELLSQDHYSKEYSAKEQLQERIESYVPNFYWGFHIVKNRGQQQLESGMTIQQGWKEEKLFFNSTAPWNTLNNRSVFGMEQLSQKLQTVQWNLLQSHLPSILDEIKMEYDNCSAALEHFGPVLFIQHHQRDLVAKQSIIEQQRRCYQQIQQDFLARLKASLSGKTGTFSPLSPKNKRPLRSQKINSHSQSLPALFENLNTKTTTTVDKSSVSQHNKKLTAAAQLHDYCSQFCQVIRQGSLATIQSVVEGAHVLITTVHGDVKGQVVHIDETLHYACVDYLEEKDHCTDILFDAVGLVLTSHAPEDALEPDEVWSDGTKVYIARTPYRYDRLRPIPISNMRTDPSWLCEKIAMHRTQDLACFINVDIFTNIVSEFVQEDWIPPCFQLVEKTQSILEASIQTALAETCQVYVPKQSGRYPNLRPFLEKTCTQVIQQVMEEAKNQVVSHLELEQHSPYTHDDTLIEQLAQARYRSLRRDLEINLRLDQEGVVLDTQAISTIMEQVFQRHTGGHHDRNVFHTNEDKSSANSNNYSYYYYMAEELEMVLSVYGQVATQRVLDRTPMICWQASRTLPLQIEQALSMLTDSMLEECFQEPPELMRQYEELTKKQNELSKALELVQSLESRHHTKLFIN